MHCKKICVSLYRSYRLGVFCKKCALKAFQILQKSTCVGVSLLKKRLQCRCFPVSFAKFLRTSFSQNISGGCFCKICWLVAQWTGRGSGEASSFRWFLGGFQWFLLVAGDIVWFQGFAVLAVTRISQHTQELFIYCFQERMQLTEVIQFCYSK